MKNMKKQLISVIVLDPSVQDFFAQYWTIQEAWPF